MAVVAVAMAEDVAFVTMTMLVYVAFAVSVTAMEIREERILGWSPGLWDVIARGKITYS